MKFRNIIEAEKSFNQWDAERKAKRAQYWQAVFLARQDYITENKGHYDLTARPTVHYWMRMKYGIIMGMDGQGNYTEEYEVEDEKKFMLFQIKYWK